MSSKRTSGSGPMLDHEPSFDTEFAVSDEALNARPDARARAGRPSQPMRGPKSGGRNLKVFLGGGAVVAAATAAVVFKLMGPAAPSAAPETPPVPAAAVAPSAPEAPEAPEAKPAPAPKPAAAPKPVAAAPVTKIAPTTLSPADDDEDEAEAEPKSRKTSRRGSKRSKRGASEEPDARLDNALAKLGSMEAPTAGTEAPAAPPSAPDRGAECEGGKAEACVAFGKELAGKDFNAALTAFERGCALGSNKGCVEGTRLAEKAGGGEKARELSNVACGRGSAPGCRLLASLFQRGVGGAPDPDKAKTFYAKACEAGDTAACGE